MGKPRLKVFLDTSALIAGLASSKGAARAVLKLAEIGAIEVFISRQVVVEADRTIEAKLPGVAGDFREYIEGLSPVFLEDPPKKDVMRFSHLINPDDAPILASAVLSGSDYLITWDKRHFISKKISTGAGLKIVTPGEFLQDFRRYAED